MEEALDVEVAPDSEVTMAPDSEMTIASDSEMAPNSVEVVPDSVEVLQCVRCGTFHAGGVFGEACFQARREARRCARCCLVHADYDLTTWILDGIENFDCELYIPDLENLQMDGDTILLPKHVQEKLDEIYSMKKLKDAKMTQDANNKQ